MAFIQSACSIGQFAVHKVLAEKSKHQPCIRKRPAIVKLREKLLECFGSRSWTARHPLPAFSNFSVGFRRSIVE